MDNANPSNILRNRIFALLNKQKVPVDIALKALTQCQVHVKDRTIIEGLGTELGMTVSGYFSDEDIEFYYDLQQGHRNIGYVSKGWDDPGFRIGEIVEVPRRKIADPEEYLRTVLTFCVTQGVAVISEVNGASIELQMDSVIYSEGLNRQVLEQALYHLQECVMRAHEFIA